MTQSENDATKSVLQHPPALNWEEVEHGLAGQLPLFVEGESPSLSERVFLSLARSWANQFKEVPDNNPPSRDVDELALCALAVAKDYGAQFTVVAENEISANIELTQKHGPFGWLDRMPWSLMQAYSSQASHDSWQVQDFIANLNHHNSAIRIWMMEIAWVIRRKLPRETVFPILLENVASTLGGVETAWALAAALFEERSSFDEAAAAWLPQNDFDEQYIKRLLKLKDQTFASQVGLWKLEATLYRRIMMHSFDGGCHPIIS